MKFCKTCTYYDRKKKWCRYGPIPEEQLPSYNCPEYWDGKVQKRTDKILDLAKLSELMDAVSDAEVKQRGALFELSNYIAYGEDKG